MDGRGANSHPHSKERGDDVFDLQTEGGRLVIRASDPSSAAMGLNGHRTIAIARCRRLATTLRQSKFLPSWCGRCIELHVSSIGYFLNYCTFNYSFAFADWPAWERELDWMALDGINLALAVNGTEAVWENTLRRFGYSDAEILAIHFRTGVHRMVAYGESGRLGRASDAADD